jgi:hypothetical protein
MTHVKLGTARKTAELRAVSPPYGLAQVLHTREVPGSIPGTPIEKTGRKGRVFVEGLAPGSEAKLNVARKAALFLS